MLEAAEIAPALDEQRVGRLHQVPVDPGRQSRAQAIVATHGPLGGWGATAQFAGRVPGHSWRGLTGSPAAGRSAPRAGAAAARARDIDQARRTRATRAPPAKGTLLREHTQLDRLIRRDAGRLLGQFERAHEPAELVDQTALMRLSARPDTALGRGPHLLLRQVAPRATPLMKASYT